MISSLLGKKIGMTQVYDSANCLVPVTVVEAGPCAVVQVKTTETDGYHAVQIGFSKKKPKNTSKAEQQHAAKAGLTDTPRVLSEVRLTAASTLKVGDIVTVTAFTEGQLVDVIGITKGKGFQGVVKRFRVGRSRGPRIHVPPPHRLDRHAPDPRPHLEEPEDARTHGQRAPHRAEPARRAGHRRQEPDP